MNKKRALLSLALAGLVAGSSAAWLQQQAQADDEVPCYGINKCKGAGECGGKSHSCAGQNACAGQGFIKMSSEKCLKIQGGRLTAEPEGA
ncbi:MAG: hypothetical protein HYZ94_02125 [Candidatus Omnitrophica bacterium]|nr:hypothetical protein [Candidatus Omnitrophota bacterium]